MYRQDDAKLLEMLLTAPGADVNATPYDKGDLNWYHGQNVVHLICRGEIDASILPVAVKAGADVNKLDADLRPPARHAISSKNVEALRVLLENGADPKWIQTDSAGEVLGLGLVHYAVKSGNHDNLRLLIKFGAPIEGRRWGHNGDFEAIAPHGYGGGTPFIGYHDPLIECVQFLRDGMYKNDKEAAQILIDAGAKIDMDLQESRTRWFVKAKQLVKSPLDEDFDMLKFLLDKGLDPNLRQYEYRSDPASFGDLGENLLYYANKLFNSKAEQLLRAHPKCDGKIHNY